jgi:hypothetical protein
VLGVHGGVFGLWLIRNLTTLAVSGPYAFRPTNLNVVPARASLSANPNTFGRLGIGYDIMGHGRSVYVA